MDARAGELAPAWVNRNGYAMGKRFQFYGTMTGGIMQLPAIGEPFSSSSQRSAGVDM